MAARLNPRQDERCRSAIQTSQLINRLNSFALDQSESVRMSSDQVRAALGLLKKTIPDLAVTQHTGPEGGRLEVDFRWADAKAQPEAQQAAEDAAAAFSIGFIDKD
jgi:hypothetical protein